MRVSKRAWLPPPFIRVDALNKGEIPANLTVPRREHVAGITLLHLDELEGEINRSRRCTCPRNGRKGWKEKRGEKPFSEWKPSKSSVFHH